MGDFSHMGIALEKVLDLPENFFEEVYLSSIAEQSIGAFDLNPVCSAIYAYFFKDGKLKESVRNINGTSSELLEKLFKKNRMSAGIINPPKSTKAFASKLKRAEPILTEYGFIVERHRTGQRREILISIDPKRFPEVVEQSDKKDSFEDFLK